LGSLSPGHGKRFFVGLYFHRRRQLAGKLPVLQAPSISLEKIRKPLGLVVLSQDYETCPEDEIKNIEALRTVVGGRIVYDKLR
jgi:hypothetical protein